MTLERIHYNKEYSFNSIVSFIKSQHEQKLQNIRAEYFKF